MNDPQPEGHMASYIERRKLLATFLGGAAAWPLVAPPQQGRVPVVGVLRPNRRDVLETFAEPFRRYMKAIGWEEGRNVRFLFVWTDGLSERAPELADELVVQSVDLIVTFGDPATREAQRATSVTPIVKLHPLALRLVKRRRGAVPLRLPTGIPAVPDHWRCALVDVTVDYGDQAIGILNAVPDDALYYFGGPPFFAACGCMFRCPSVSLGNCLVSTMRRKLASRVS